MESLEKAYGIFLTIVLVILAILVILCLVRAIIGPRVADRIVSVNMMRSEERRVGKECRL